MGYGLLGVDVTGPPRALAWGCLVAERGEPIEYRLHQLAKGLREVIAWWQPDHLAVEEPFVAPARGAKSAVAVGQAQAVALLLAAEAGMAVHRYPPAQVKRMVGDYGAGSKVQVQRMVRRLLGIAGDLEEDASDALAVALCHLQVRRVEERMR